MLRSRPLSGCKHRRRKRPDLHRHGSPVSNIEIGGHGGLTCNSVDPCDWRAFFHANGGASFLPSAWPCCLGARESRGLPFGCPSPGGQPPRPADGADRRGHRPRSASSPAVLSALPPPQCLTSALPVPYPVPYLANPMNLHTGRVRSFKPTLRPCRRRTTFVSRKRPACKFIGFAR